MITAIWLALSPAAGAEAVSATLVPGITAAAVQAAPNPIDVATFRYRDIAWTVRCKASTATTVKCTADRAGRSIAVSALSADTTGTTASFADPELKDASVKLGGIVLRMDAEDVDE